MCYSKFKEQIYIFWTKNEHVASAARNSQARGFNSLSSTSGQFIWIVSAAALSNEMIVLTSEDFELVWAGQARQGVAHEPSWIHLRTVYLLCVGGCCWTLGLYNTRCVPEARCVPDLAHARRMLIKEEASRVSTCGKLGRLPWYGYMASLMNLNSWLADKSPARPPLRLWALKVYLCLTLLNLIQSVFTAG